MKYVFKNKFYLLLIWGFDLLGNILFLPVKLINKKRIKEINNILLIRLDHIGDVIYSTHLPQNLKQYYPKAKITFLTANTTKEIISDNPHVDRIICYDAPWFKRKEKKTSVIARSETTKQSLQDFFKLTKELREDKYDLGIDLRGDIRHILLMVLAKVKFKAGFGITGGGFLLDQEAYYRKGLHPIEHNLDLLKSIGINPASAELQFQINQKSKDSADRFLKENSLNKTKDFITVIHPYAGYNSKNWADDKFAELIITLVSKYNAKIILTGSQKDKAGIENIIKISRTQSINASGETSLQELFALIKDSALFIGVDSGPSHIASLSDKPAIILYSGTNRKEEWAPKADKTVLIQKNVSCGNCEKLNCPKNICMDLISVQDVLNEVEKAIKQ